MSGLTKHETDTLYHLLRKASILGNLEREPLKALSSYLLGPGSYEELELFLSDYGRRFVISGVITRLQMVDWKFERIVDLGAGNGWFGDSVASAVGVSDVIRVDKRAWTRVDYVLDLEQKADIATLKDLLRPTDTIVMSELIHCLKEPKVLLDELSSYNMIIVEYCPDNTDWRMSWKDQLTARGGDYLGRERLMQTVLSGRMHETYYVASNETHYFMLVSAKEEEKGGD